MDDRLGNTQATSSETSVHFTEHGFISLEENILIANSYKRTLLNWNMQIGRQCTDWVRWSRWILVFNLHIVGSS